MKLVEKEEFPTTAVALKSKEADLCLKKGGDTRKKTFFS